MGHSVIITAFALRVTVQNLLMHNGPQCRIGLHAMGHSMEPLFIKIGLNLISKQQKYM
jgi:hypothetical protein